MKLPSSWRSNSRKTLRTVQDLALNWSASTRPSGPNSRCLIDGPLASRSGILPQGCMSPGCPAFLSPPVKAGFTVSFQPGGGGGGVSSKQSSKDRTLWSLLPHTSFLQGEGNLYTMSCTGDHQGSWMGGRGQKLGRRGCGSLTQEKQP